MTIQAVSFGELLIDFVALERDVSVGYARRFEKVPGGAPANVAVGLAKLDIATAFITQLGDDPFGHYLHDVLQENGVNTSGIRFSQEARTALAFASIDADGERSFAFYRHPSADMLMTADALDENLLKQVSIFHFGSITLIDDPVRSTTMTAIDIARRHNSLISYDPNLRMALWPSAQAAREGMLAGLREANIVKMNEEELAFLTGVDTLPDDNDKVEAAQALWHDALHLLIITRGPVGAMAVTPHGHWMAAGYSVQVEDTIGAGDGFMAGLLAGILAHSPVSYDSADTVLPLLKQANAVGALTASKRGAIPALPDALSVHSFLSGV